MLECNLCGDNYDEDIEPGSKLEGVQMNDVGDISTVDAHLCRICTGLIVCQMVSTPSDGKVIL